MTKRYATRIEIPGTTLRFYNDSKKTFFPKSFAEESELINLSKSGASFFVSEPPLYGEKLTMRFIFPDGEIIKLAGSVRWVREDVNRFLVGVLFDPFGRGKEYNSPKALKYLKNKFQLEKVEVKKKEAGQNDEYSN
jgi:hypothetical protein